MRLADGFILAVDGLEHEDLPAEAVGRSNLGRAIVRVEGTLGEEALRLVREVAGDGHVHI